jgi:hypothetical protein
MFKEKVTVVDFEKTRRNTLAGLAPEEKKVL